MSRSKIIIGDGALLDNIHPGEVLREDFLIGTEIAVDELSRETGIPLDIMSDIVGSRRNIDAAIDARLARYFGMSEGFFLRLQNEYDLEEVRCRDGDALDRIVPRAA